tara:strand:- start:13995 stop:15536 length:1542 start_codon:yes stop_codon:yes gene_type:complete
MGNEVRSCNDVYDRAARAAAGMRDMGVGVGSSIAILMRNAIEYLEVSAAAAHVGAYAVPLNWHLAPAEISYVLEDCGAKLLIVHSDLLNLVPTELLHSVDGVDVIIVNMPDAIRDVYPLMISEVRPPADAKNWEEFLLANEPLKAMELMPERESIIYTSGTTGRPKGIIRNPATEEQRQKLNRMREETYHLKEGIRLLVPAPLYHAAPNVFSLCGLQVAAMVVLMPKFDPEEFLRIIEREKITTIVMVPIMFVRLLKLPVEVRSRYDLGSLTAVLHAAAPCPPDIKSQMIEWLGPIIYEWYGTTETSVVTQCSTEEWLKYPGTVGKPIPGATIEIIDDNGNAVPPNTEGEIYMNLEFMPDFTYHNREEERAKVSRGGLTTGGDIGYLNDDGYLFICDRKKDMIISGGVNIYPAEIEAVLISMPEIYDCAVIGIPDAEFGEAILAVVVANVPITEETIVEHLATRMAKFKIPRSFEFREFLPRDDAGKLLKRRLREPFLKIDPNEDPIKHTHKS